MSLRRRFLLPVSSVQGLWVTRTTPRLPAPTGPATGLTFPIAGDSHAPEVTMTVLGEATAAGYGAPDHESALAGRLAVLLSEKWARPVRWTAVGQVGATARRVHRHLLDQTPERTDLGILIIGVTDVLTRRPASAWAKDLDALLRAFQQRATAVVMAGAPPLGRFPTLPEPLRGTLGEWADELNEAAARVCASLGVAFAGNTVDLRVAPDFFAADGFHPGPDGYRRWAELFASHVPWEPPLSPRRDGSTGPYPGPDGSSPGAR